MSYANQTGKEVPSICDAFHRPGAKFEIKGTVLAGAAISLAMERRRTEAKCMYSGYTITPKSRKKTDWGRPTCAVLFAVPSEKVDNAINEWRIL